MERMPNSGSQGSGVREQALLPRSFPRGRNGAVCHRTLKPASAAVLIVTALCIAALGPGCSRQKEGKEAVAWVNGEAIPFSAFWDEIKNRYNEVSEASSPQQDVLGVLKSKVLSDLIRERLLLQEASRRGITVSDTEFEARIDEIREGYADSSLRKSLIKHAMDYDQWRRALRENMIMEALFTSVVREVRNVTAEEVSQYYQDHLDEFLLPEAVELSQIVVKSRSNAQRLLRRIRKGESFEALAEEYSIAPEKEESGSLGTYRRGELPEPLEKAAFSTPTGKVTSLVETQHGFHLLKVVRRIPSHVQPKEEAHDQIVRKLSRQKEQAFYDQWVERLVSESDIRVHASLVHLIAKEERPKTIPFKNEANREAQ
jgi:foldase protein PrsA